MSNIKNNQIGAAAMRALAQGLNEILKPKGLGFTLFVFEFNKPNLCNYISTAERESMLKGLRETYKRLADGQDIDTPEEN